MDYTVTNAKTGQTVTVNYFKQNAAGRWVEIDEQDLKYFLSLAVEYQTKVLADRFEGRRPEYTTVDEAFEKLLNTGSVKYDDEWYAEVAVRRAKQQEQKPEFSQKLDCGHTVYDPAHIMQTSYCGTACPDCYDAIESQS